MRAKRITGTDEGFSLIETLVALTLVIVTMATMGTYLIKSFGYVAHQRTEQVAGQLANSALEQVRALKGDSLASGRTLASVTSQISSAPASVQKFLSGTSPASDDYASGTDATIPTTALTMKVDTTSFTRQIYVGECEIYLKASGVPPCTVAKTARTGSSSDYLRFYRAVVLITWPDHFCNAATCEYVASTLIARAAEPTFNIKRPAMDVNPDNLTFYFYKDVALESLYTIPVSGGQLPVKWSFTPTEKLKIPDGLNINEYGVVSGTPNKVAATSVTGTAKDAAGNSLPAALSFNIVAAPKLDPLSKTSSYVGDPVSLKATVTGGSGHNTFTMTDAPGTLTMDKDGNITGTVTEPGKYTFMIACTDSSGTAVDYEIPPTPYTYTFLTPIQLTIADQRVTMGGSAFAAKATATGGDQKYTYTYSDLPPGVAGNATDGTISGVPTASGRYMPTVKVTDGLGGTVSKTFVFIVDAGATTSLKFTAPPLDAPDPTAKFTTNDQLLGLNSVSSATGAPPGVNFNSAAQKFTGTPKTSGTYQVTVTASTLLPPVRSTTYTFLWTVP